jgi:hypothetical protein
MVLGGLVVAGLIGLEIGPPLVGCDVKANISFTTGEKIYHMPGQEYYWQTRINRLSGERWFCSESAVLRADSANRGSDLRSPG